MVRGLIESQWCEAADTEALAKKLSEAVAANLSESIKLNGRASLVVSGGSTPLPFFKQLAQAKLDWSAIDVTLADERWVPESDGDSNARFVKEHFLVGAAAAATFYSLYRNTDPESSTDEIEHSLSKMIQPFSVVILGMGGDGHTASLFPNTRGLDAALDIDATATVAILQPKSVPQTRITLTRAALLRSRYRYLHITGKQKHDVLESALNPQDKQALPIASFFEKHLPPISVYWAP